MVNKVEPAVRVRKKRYPAMLKHLACLAKKKVTTQVV
jgi:hypothetical protein